MATYRIPGTNIKAVSLDSFPEEAWTTNGWSSATRKEQPDIQDIYKNVATIFRCVDIRANAMLKIPWTITQGENVLWESKERPPQGLQWAANLSTLLRLTMSSKTLVSEAFWFVERNRVKPTALRWWSPLATRPVWDPMDGLTHFLRTGVMSERRIFMPEEVVYIWDVSPLHETEPKPSATQAAMAAANVLYNLDTMSALYFQRGGIRPTILTVSGNPSAETKDAIVSWYRRAVSGIRNAFATNIFDADRMDSIQLGDGLAELDSSVISEDKRKDIAIAMGVPHSMIMADAANYATAQQDEANFYNSTVIPEAQAIAEDLNAQLFAPLNLHFRWEPDTMDIFQQDEAQRADAYSTYVGAKMPAPLVAEMLGLELPDGWEYSDLEEDEPEPVPPQLLAANAAAQGIAPPQEQAGEEEDDEEDTDPPEETAKAVEAEKFRRWLKKNPNRIGRMADFKSDVLTPADKREILLDITTVAQKGKTEDGAAEDTFFTLAKFLTGPITPESWSSFKAAFAGEKAKKPPASPASLVTPENLWSYFNEPFSMDKDVLQAMDDYFDNSGLLPQDKDNIAQNWSGKPKPAGLPATPTAQAVSRVTGMPIYDPVIVDTLTFLPNDVTLADVKEFLDNGQHSNPIKDGKLDETLSFMDEDILLDLEDALGQMDPDDLKFLDNKYDPNAGKPKPTAGIAQLDPLDDEAEQLARMSVEKKATKEIADGLDDWVDEGLNGISASNVDEIAGQFAKGGGSARDALQRALIDSVDLGVSVATEQFKNVGFGLDWTMANTDARKWAQKHTEKVLAQLKATNGKIVAESISRWVDNGEPFESLVKDLEGKIGGRTRAELVASTEVTRAYAEGNRAAYESSGVVEKVEWRTAFDEMVCPICGQLNGARANVKNPQFTSTIGVPPAHPRCRCWIVPVIEIPALDILEPMPEPEPVAPPKPKKTRKPKGDGFPEDVTQLEKVKDLGGSTGATLVKDPKTGKLYVRKKGNNREHLLSEFQADETYRAMGVNVPRGKLYYDGNNNPIKLTEFHEGETLGALRYKNPAAYEKARAKVQEGFSADVLLGNWDVAGEGLDNILVDSAGEVWRIDNGGALFFRAQGARKSSFGPHTDEFWTMRKPGVNPNAVTVFGDMGMWDIEKQMTGIAGNRKAILASITDDEIRDAVAARLDTFEDLAGISKTFRLDKWTEDYTDDFLKHSVGLRKYGIVDKFPKQFTNEGVLVRDENGHRWDNLRRHRDSNKNSVMQEFDGYLTTNGGNSNVYVAWAGDQAGDSWSRKAQAGKYFYTQTGRPTGEYWWKNGLDNAKGHYDDLARHYGKSAVDTTFTAMHALNHELMRNTDFKHNNRAKGFVKLIRTEDTDVMRRCNFKMGTTQKMPRGAVESFSIYRKVTVYGTELTEQQVPHHRIFANYWMERGPGRNTAMFLGDGENEFVAMTDGLDIKYKSGHGW